MTNSLVTELQRPRWIRSRSGYLAGVCEGIGRSFDVDPWLIRICWLVAVLAFGTGLVLYIVLTFTLPREDRFAAAEQRRFLGVCAHLAQKYGIEVGAVRTMMVLFSFASLGLTALGYFVVYFVINNEQKSLATR